MIAVNPISRDALITASLNRVAKSKHHYHRFGDGGNQQQRFETNNKINQPDRQCGHSRTSLLAK
jgi:hypothetical protein